VAFSVYAVSVMKIRLLDAGPRISVPAGRLMSLPLLMSPNFPPPAT
jgi:hypothetical protein